MDGDRPRILLAMDTPGAMFRHEFYNEYKAKWPSAPIDLIPQFDFIREAATAYGMTMVEKESFEADDVIATLSRLASEDGVDVNILSGDKDLMQLMTNYDSDSDKGDDGYSPGQVQMIDPMSMECIDHKGLWTNEVSRPIVLAICWPWPVTWPTTFLGCMANPNSLVLSRNSTVAAQSITPRCSWRRILAIR